MNADEFGALATRKIASRPRWFSGTEAPLPVDQITTELERLGLGVPDEMVLFSSRFGAGYFGTINVSSFDRGSSWYRWDKPVIMYDGQPLVVVSDDETGGVYGFLVAAGKCSQAVYYANFERNQPTPEKVAETFLDFVANTAFEFD